MMSTVAWTQCASYDPDTLQPALDRLLLNLGGMQAFVRSGQSVFIKPNLLSDRTPDRAVTTHPELVRAVIRLVKACGGIPKVGDSAANVLKIESVWDKTGMRAVCEAESVPLVRLEQSGSVAFEHEGQKVGIAQCVRDADVVINLPKFKTHTMTLLTNAVKNLYGTLPGYQKVDMHKRFFGIRRFGGLLAELYQQVRPALTISDAVWGMEGEGPSGGQPIPLGGLAASADGVALDWAMARHFGIPTERVAYLQILRKQGIGPSDWNDIQQLGDLPPAQTIRLPGVSPLDWIPPSLARWLTPWFWIRPSFDERCRCCGLCIRTCPVNALAPESDGRPRLATPRACVECCCCQEICPEKAIRMKPSPLLAFVARGRLAS